MAMKWLLPLPKLPWGNAALLDVVRTASLIRLRAESKVFCNSSVTT